MSSKTDKLENLLVDFIYRGQTLSMGGQTATWAGAPTFTYGLLSVYNWAATQAVALNVFTVRPDASSVLRLLKCTTAGTTGASAPTAPSTTGGTVVDGTVTWTEQTTAVEAATIATLGGTTLPTELSGGSYARQSILASLANWAGTQSAGSTTASTGTSGTTSNNNVITFNTGTISGTNNAVGMFFISDVAAVNIYFMGFITGGPVLVTTGATATFAAAALTIQEDN
jgi:hypothetical protein